MIMGGILAIRSPNFVQIWKGSDQKIVFFQGETKKYPANDKTFFMSNPVKKLFFDQNLSM